MALKFTNEIAHWQAEVDRLTPLTELEEVFHRHDWHLHHALVEGSANKLALAKQQLAFHLKEQRQQAILDAFSRYDLLNNQIGSRSGSASDLQAELALIVDEFPHFTTVSALTRPL